MTRIFMTVLSMSLSGAVLILLVLLAGRVLKGKLGRQWQYYIWLIAVMRLLLPFGPKVSLMELAYQTADRVITQRTQVTHEAGLGGRSMGQDSWQMTGQSDGPGYGKEDRLRVEENPGQSAGQDTGAKGASFLVHAAAFAGKYLWTVWLAAALAMLIRKITIYQSYTRYVKAGAEPVCDIPLLDRLTVTAQRLGIDRPVELCVNPQVSSPMLVGYFHPCIILSGADISEKEFQWIAMHELTHYRRRDIWFKWMVQVTVCLHWFNPLVHLMSREIDRVCEFSCDEAVVAKTGYDHAADYGKTLLNAMAAGGICREPFAAVTMSANKELLRERLGAIMNCRKKSKATGIITAGLTVGIALGAVFLGVYPAVTVAAESDRAGETALSAKENGKAGVGSREEQADAGETEAWAKAEQYYESRSLPMIHIVFYELGEKEQELWLDRFYADDEIAFFSVGAGSLDADNPLIQAYAEKFYQADEIAFFSVLTDMMEKEALEGWLDRALADEKSSFCSVLYDELGMDEEGEKLEKAMEEELREEYRAAGVTWSGKNYYYQGQLVNIFLDIHTPNEAFYTLNMNPAGKVNVKIVRAQDGKITGVAYMTEAEVEELLGDLYGEEEGSGNEADGENAVVFPQEMTVCMPACYIREGAGAEFQAVGLLGEGEIVTVLGRKEDTGGQMWYLLDQESLPERLDVSVKACYIRGDLLE